MSQPLDEQTELPPAADDAVPMQPVEISGLLTLGGCTDGTSEAVDLVFQIRGGSCWPAIAEWTDQRLNGDVTMATNEDVYADASGLRIVSWAYSIENDAGTWRMRPNTEVSFRGSGEQPPQVLVLDGDGAYEGLTAVLRQGEEGPYGYIIESGMPPAPDNASTTS